MSNTVYPLSVSTAARCLLADRHLTVPCILGLPFGDGWCENPIVNPAGNPTPFAMHSIASHARSARARCQSGYKHLTPAKSFGYHPPVSSKKGLIGFDSSTHQAAQSRDTAQVCGFFVRAPVFGGSDGEPQGSPVKGLRLVPGLSTRSSCHPRLTAGVAVDQLHHLEAIMAQLITAGIAALIASDLVIEINPRWVCRFRGTRAQLVAEGLIPNDFKWPHRTQCQSWEAGKFEYWMQRCRPDGIKGPQSVWADGDYWVINMSVKGIDYITYRFQENARELAELVQGKSSEWSKTWNCAYKARQDDKYMAFRTHLLGELAPRKRGRPAKARPVTPTQGATHV